MGLAGPSTSRAVDLFLMDGFLLVDGASETTLGFLGECLEALPTGREACDSVFYLLTAGSFLTSGGTLPLTG